VVDQVQGALWMRHMVLGPAHEFCVHAAAPVSGLAMFNALVMPLQRAWPELANGSIR